MNNFTENLSSKQKGDIIENRVAETIALSSKGNLTCFTPYTDDDGIDLIINKKGKYTPLFLQVKGRFVLQKNGSYIQNIGKQTFRENDHFYLLFVYFCISTLEVKTLWLIPSSDLAQKAYDKKAGKTYKDFYRFNAFPNGKNGKWTAYQIDKSDLGEKLLEIINNLYPDGQELS